MSGGQKGRDKALRIPGPLARRPWLRSRRLPFGRLLREKPPEGQAQVEFVLSTLFVVLLIFGVFELTMLLYTYNVLADSAKEGVRYGVVHGSLSANATSSNGSNTCSGNSLGPVYQQVCNFASASFHDVSGMSVTVTYPDGTAGSSTNPPNAPPNRLQVQVSYPYKPLLGLSWEATTVNIKAAAEGRIDF